MDEEKIDRVRAALASVSYTTNFQEALRYIVVNALPSDPLIASLEMHSLYPTSEIIAAAEAAEAVGMTVEEGAATFVFLSAAVRAESQKRTLWGRIKAKKTPKAGTRDYNHLLLVNYALENTLNGINPSLSQQFAGQYAEILARNVN